MKTLILIIGVLMNAYIQIGIYKFTISENAMSDEIKESLKLNEEEKEYGV